MVNYSFRFYEAMNGRPSQCYLFKSCGRKVENATFDCMLNKENTLEVHPFVDTESECETHCQEVRYFQIHNKNHPKINTKYIYPF